VGLSLAVSFSDFYGWLVGLATESRVQGRGEAHVGHDWEFLYAFGCEF
jgi:hypothetical protein